VAQALSRVPWHERRGRTIHNVYLGKPKNTHKERSLYICANSIQGWYADLTKIPFVYHDLSADEDAKRRWRAKVCFIHSRSLQTHKFPGY